MFQTQPESTRVGLITLNSVTVRCQRCMDSQVSALCGQSGVSAVWTVRCQLCVDSQVSTLCGQSGVSCGVATQLIDSCIAMKLIGSGICCLTRESS